MEGRGGAGRDLQWPGGGGEEGEGWYSKGRLCPGCPLPSWPTKSTASPARLLSPSLILGTTGLKSHKSYVSHFHFMVKTYNRGERRKKTWRWKKKNHKQYVTNTNHWNWVLHLHKSLTLTARFALQGPVLRFSALIYQRGFPAGSVVKNTPANAGDEGDHRFDPWVGKIPWSSKWQPTPVFLPGESCGERSLATAWPTSVPHCWAVLSPVCSKKWCLVCESELIHLRELVKNNSSLKSYVW